MVKKIKKIIEVIILLSVAFTVLWLYLADFGKGQRLDYGVTFSQKYAAELGLNWREAYLAILNDLSVKKLRLIAYWDLLERARNKYDFRDLDWQIEQAQANNAQIILTIGQRVPRWPECHEPVWSKTLSQEEKEKELLEYLTVIIKRYQTNPAIIAWQPENEPFLRVFGHCPKLNKDFYQKELAQIRSLDNRPLVVTESGELSTWLKAGKVADYVGTSVYRITWNKYWGYFYYPLPPAYYYLKMLLVKLVTPIKGVLVSEMQMEPWLGKPIVSTPLAEQALSMNAGRFQKNFRYIRKTGLSPVYFWGVEWWYWLKEQGDDSIWNLAKQLLAK